MVASKETPAAIIALHQNGLTCKGIAAKNIAPERTIYRIVKHFKERGSTAVKNASRRPRVSRTPQDLLLLRSPPVQSLLNIGSRWVWVCTHSEAKTFGQRPGVKKGSKEATSLQEKHQGKTEIQQEAQGLDSRRLVQSYFLWWSPLLTVWDIWKIDCPK